MGRVTSVVLGLVLSSPVFGQLSCSAANYGPSCGPTLSATFQPLGSHQRIVFQMTGGYPDSVHGQLIIGLINPNYPIPGTSCFLLTDWYFGHGFAWQEGTAVVTHSWPNEVIGLLRFQAFAFRLSGQGVELMGSNGVAATCLLP
ncbi:MAG: hypothetical protein R3F56_19750 [Planctomycetota bacterium]